MLTYLSGPVCNWAIYRLARLCRTNVVIEKSRMIENKFHSLFLDDSEETHGGSSQT